MGSTSLQSLAQLARRLETGDIDRAAALKTILSVPLVGYCNQEDLAHRAAEFARRELFAKASNSSCSEVHHAR